MQPLERINDYEEALRTAMEGLMAGLWVASPGIVQSYNAAAQTVTVQPSLRVPVRQPDGTIKMTTLPLLVDVPCQFFGAGGFTVTAPVAEGDECLVVFANMCIDAWWQQGGVQPPMEARMHDLSDGFAILGFRSQPRVLSNVSTTSLQVRSDDGQTYFDLSSGKIQLVANEIIVHGRNKAVFDAGGTGFVYQPAQIDTYTDGVTSNHHAPNPPEVPS